MTKAKQFKAAGVAIILATAALAASPARAADMGAEPLLPPPAAEPLVEWGSGWYLRGDIGVSNEKRDPMMRLPGLQSSVKSGTGFGVDVGAGFAFGDNFRTDLTLGVRKRYDQNLTSSYDCVGGAPDTCSAYASTRVERYPILANAYYDFGRFGGLRPYIGAGVGIGIIDVSWARTDTFSDGTQIYAGPGTPGFTQTPLAGAKTNVNLSYALMAGVGYDLSDGFTLDLGYRFLDMGKVRFPGSGTSAKLRDHEVRVGLRYRID
jgi:opacity protein-like surface antigen